MNLADAIRREPALFGTAAAATADGACYFAGASTTTQTVVHGIVLAWLALLVRSLSTPTVKADEATAAAADAATAQVEVAKYVGAVEHQAVAAAGRILKASTSSSTRRRGGGGAGGAGVVGRSGGAGGGGGGAGGT